MPGSRCGRSTGALVAAACLLLCLGAGLVWYWTPPNSVGNDPQPSPDASHNDSAVSPETLKLAIEAVAAAEDAEYERAMRLWKQLLQVFPDDAAIQLNQAVTVLKWIDETNSRLRSGMVADPQKQEALEGELEGAYQEADSVVAKLSQLETADYRAKLLEAALLEAKARNLQYPQDQELRGQAADVLAAALANSAQPVMACKFDDLVQELAGDNDELSQKNADALFAAWKSQPRNLYLLSRAAETLLRSEDPRVVELLDPSLELTQPMLSMVASQLRRIDPQQLLDQVREAVESGDWRGAQRLRLWLNLLKGLSGFQPDVRLVKPDIMALLDTSFLNRLSSQGEFPLEMLGARPEYRRISLNTKAMDLAWYDYDVDLKFDLVVLQGASLQLFTQSTTAEIQFQARPPVELGFQARGLLVADLFEVDAPNRPRAPATVAELMVENDSTPGNEENAPPEGQPSESDVAAGNRHDTLQELVVWGDDGIVLVGAQQEDSTQQLRLVQLDGDMGLGEVKQVTAIAALDIESDGDLDLVVATASGIRVFQNNGNRTFVDISEYSQFENAPAGLTRLVVADYDADLDQDLLSVSPDSGSILLFENILHGQFRFRKLEESAWPKLAQATDIAVADLDGNASWDWITASEDGVAATTTRTPAPGNVAPLQSQQWAGGATHIEVADLNNDSCLDLVAGTQHGLQAYFGDGSGKVSEESMPFPSASQDFQTFDILDCNQDGGLDIAAVDAEGSVTLWLAELPAQAHFLNVRVRGINDVNGGGRVNHYAIGSTVEVWNAGHQQRRVVRQPATHFGLGATEADNLRIVFANGLTQNLESPPVNTLVEERQELKGSCPFVYGWNGRRFELITDLLWNAPLGLQVARGHALPDRRWEHLMLPGELVRQRDGAYELRITEELWEVAYLDHVRLTAIDHPGGTEVFTNEKVGPPQLAEPRLFLFREAIRPVAATTSRGDDVLARLAKRDQVYGQPFEQLICQGLAEPHFVELNFGELPDEEGLQLVLTGWMHPTDTSLNIGIAQNSDRPAPEPPSLWVLDDQDQWVCTIPQMGFPGGKPKTIVVNLDGVFRSQDRRIRIGGSQQIFWDEAYIAQDSAAADLVEQTMALESANLRYRGFSQLLPRSPDQPHWYDYQQTSSAAKWPELQGPFTRFGNVRDLLTTDDDRMVVMTSGDEVVLRFQIPPRELPNGWQRDFVLYSVGWDKDADLNTLAGQGSLPLPFANQVSYPPPPEQASEAQAVYQKNADSLIRSRQYVPEQAWQN